MCKIDFSQWDDTNISDEEWLLKYETSSQMPRKIYDIERERILAMNEADQELHFNQLMKILGEYNTLIDMELEYQKNGFFSRLDEFGIRELPCDMTTDDFINKWEELYTDKHTAPSQCRWDYLRKQDESLIVLKGQEAKAAFNNATKNIVYIFSEDENELSKYQFSKKVESSLFRLFYGEDIYFIDEHYCWTYILPHENINSPYWISISDKESK